MEIPDSLKQRIDIFRERGMILHYPEEMFGPTSWLAIMMGQGVRPAGYSPILNTLDRAEEVKTFKRMQMEIQAALAELPSQDRYLKDRNWVADEIRLQA